MSRVKLFATIRREHRDGASIRGLADSHREHRRTVRHAMEDAVPPPRKTPERDWLALGFLETLERGTMRVETLAGRTEPLSVTGNDLRRPVVIRRE